MFLENSNNVIVKDAILELHPELVESNDERIRKRLIDCLKFSLKGAEEQDAAGCSRQKDIEAYQWGIAYLEKQKNQKPVNWTELNWEDINKLEVFINTVHNEYPNGIGQESFGQEVLERFREYKGDEHLDEKEQKPMEVSDDELQKYQDELYDFKVFAAKQAKDQHISFVHDFEWNNFCAELFSYFNERQSSVESIPGQI